MSRSRPLPAIMAVLMAAALCAACSASNPLSWEITFAAGVDSSRVSFIEGEILQGGCVGGSRIWSARVGRTETPGMPPELPADTYGFTARAISAECEVFAEACVELTLPTSDSVVTIELAAVAPRAECAALCRSGVCLDVDSGMPDAEVDAAAPDAGSLDAGSADAGSADAGCESDLECGECGRCLEGRCAAQGDGAMCAGGRCHSGACCAGCVIAGACVVGDTPVACGTAGIACERCECPTDACEAGACAVGHPVTAVATSDESSCVVSGSGLFCFGSNSAGQLGIGTSGVGTEVDVPTRAMTTSTFTALRGGDDHMLGLVGARLYTWGDNADGQLGLGDVIARMVPTVVSGSYLFFDGARAGDHSCVISMDSSLACTGQGYEGQLGLGDLLIRTSFTPISADWRAVATGHHHSCAINRTGALYCWGENLFGELGQGTSGAGTDQTSPVRVGTDTDWNAIAAGDGFTCGIRAGSLYCWGLNTQGQCAQPTAAITSTPVRVGTDSDWQSVSLGVRHACGLRAGGALLCWGRNAEGQLGRGAVTGSSRTPVRVGTSGGWSRVALGGVHTCAADGLNALYCWGGNGLGQLGLGDRDPRAAPTAVCW